MTDRTTIPPAAFELTHVWKHAPQNDPGTVRWFRENLARVADALDMLRACGPTYAAVRAVVEAWTAALDPEGDGPDAARCLVESRPDVTDALEDLVHTSRAGRPSES